jgi:hypothetical protein
MIQTVTRRKNKAKTGTTRMKIEGEGLYSLKASLKRLPMMWKNFMKF